MADLNLIRIAWDGYQDEQDDLFRAMYRSAGGKYPDKKPRFSQPGSFRAMTAHLKRRVVKRPVKK